MYRFEKLIAWQKAMDLVEEIYRATSSFPRDEQFGLTSQIRRASTSIALNLAEGSACKGRREFSKFCYISLRSQYEVAATLLVCRRLGLVSDESFASLTRLSDEAGRLVQALATSLESTTDRLGEDSIPYSTEPLVSTDRTIDDD